MKYIYASMDIPCPAWIFVISAIVVALPFLAFVYLARHLPVSNGQDKGEKMTTTQAVVPGAMASLIVGPLIGILVLSVCYDCYCSSTSTRERMVQAEHEQKMCFVEVVEIEPQAIYINADGLQEKQMYKVVLSNDETVMIEKNSQLYKAIEKSDFKDIKMVSKDGKTWYLATTAE